MKIIKTKIKDLLIIKKETFKDKEVLENYIGKLIIKKFILKLYLIQEKM